MGWLTSLIPGVNWLQLGAGAVVGIALSQRPRSTSTALTRALWPKEQPLKARLPSAPPNFSSKGQKMMLKSAILMTGLCALSFSLTGCQTVPATEGAGFVRTTPSAETVKYITTNDRRFAEQTAGNNRACNRSAACAK